MLITALASLALQAQTPPSCDAEEYRQFDFWIGSWDVYAANDQKVGTNVITSEENGCLLVERWTNAQGGTGQSYNYFDPGTGLWRQVWVSQGFVIDYDGGLDDDGAMVLKGTLTPRTGQGETPFRGRWTPMDDGSVQQTFWTWDAEAESWNVWFDANYRRRTG